MISVILQSISQNRRRRVFKHEIVYFVESLQIAKFAAAICVKDKKDVPVA